MFSFGPSWFCLDSWGAGGRLRLCLLLKQQKSHDMLCRAIPHMTEGVVWELTHKLCSARADTKAYAGRKLNDKFCSARSDANRNTLYDDNPQDTFVAPELLQVNLQCESLRDRLSARELISCHLWEVVMLCNAKCTQVQTLQPSQAPHTLLLRISATMTSLSLSFCLSLCLCINIYI